MTTFHRCRHCLQDKLLSEFPKADSRYRLGIHSRCRICTAAYHRAYYARRKDPYKQQVWDASKKARSLLRAEATRKRAYERRRAQYWSDPELYRERNRLKGLRYLVRKQQLPASLTTKEWRDILALFDNRCAYCFAPQSALLHVLHKEHIVPVSAGGPLIADNVVPACRSCNARKRNKSLLAFMASGGVRW